MTEQLNWTELKSYPILCNPMDCSHPSSSVLGISQARKLEWVTISFFRGSFGPRDWTHIYCTGRKILYQWATWKTLRQGAIFNREKTVFFNKRGWENWTVMCKRLKVEYSLTPYTKINSKWIKHLNVRPDTIKLLQENIGRIVSYINFSRIFFIHLLEKWKVKTKINKGPS